MSIKLCPYTAPGRQLAALGSNEKLYDAVQTIGLLSNAKILVDIGDPISYSGTGNTLTNRALGQPNYSHAGTFQLVDPYYASFINDTNQQSGDWGPSGGTRVWSDTLHKAGGVLSFCAVLRINSTADWFPLFGTWGNLTATTGFMCSMSASSFGMTAWRSSNQATLTISYDGFPPVGTWMFLACTFGDGVSNFARINDQYANMISYRTGVNSNQTPVGLAGPLVLNYASPTGNNAQSDMLLMGIPGSNNANMDVDLAFFGMWDIAIGEATFDVIFNAIRGRYGL